MEQDDFRDNAARGRFELTVDGQIVFADYQRRPGLLAITHVEAPPQLRGTGAAGRLMQGLAEQARAEGVRIAPLCPYARLWLQRHPDYIDLIV